jgi:TM2 domain-containing membrane protein YozV
MNKLLSILFMFLLFGKLDANENYRVLFTDSSGNIIDSAKIEAANFESYNTGRNRPNPILQIIKRKQKQNKKIVAAALAFPFPFGIVGLHRIYLGTAPHVPVVYIGSLGGIFGILPFIDFCVLVLDKDFDRYNNNNKIFMWVN